MAKFITHDVEQGSPEWHALHIGIASASVFSRLVTSTGAESDGLEDYAMDLALEKFNGEVSRAFKGNWTTERGHEFEPEACSDYEMIKQEKIDHVGFITDNLMRYGCSPDGLIGKDGGYEAKCKTDKVHLKMLMAYDENGMTPSEYIAQTQGCMFVTGRKWWDLHLYHPKMRSVIIRQYPDMTYFKALRKQLKVIEARRNVLIEFMKKTN